jgi:hypothetical protein
MQTEQASMDAAFVCQRHYFLSLQNIEHACFNALDLSVNNAFKVLNDPTIQGWHMGMSTHEILDQLSTSYGQPTPAAMELNGATFRGPYSATDAPKVLFCHIKNCVEIAIMGNNPYTYRQLIMNAVHLLLTTLLYQRAFKEWDRSTAAQQTWIALRTLIQEAFQRCLNAAAPTAGHLGYAPARPFQKNAFGVLTEDDNNDNNKLITATVATQVAALTYQSQLPQSTAVNRSQRQDQQMAQIAAVHDATHKTLHQLINGMNALAFNVSNAGRRCIAGWGYGGHGRGCSCQMGRGRGPQTYIGGFSQGFPPNQIMPPMGTGSCTIGFSSNPQDFPGGGQYGGIPPFRASPDMNVRYSNLVKKYAN